MVITVSKYHAEIRRFRIFALILEEDFFIGKTASLRISAVYSRHRCGHVAATRDIMDQEKPPALYILEDLNCTGAEAYRHILAWICRFEEEGYCTINHTGTAISSEHLYPHTEEILNRLLRESMGEILARSFVSKPSDADLRPPRKPAFLPHPEKQVQMNLRMSEKDKKNFDRFCKKHHLKSREALGLLLDQITGEDTHRQMLLSEQALLRQEKDSLKKQLAICQGKVLSPREQKTTDFVHFLKIGCAEYLQHLFPEEQDQIQVLPYKRFQMQNRGRYEYPESEGFLLLTVQAVFWGRNKARFVIGQGPDGEFRKLRYYSKPLYAGALIWEYPAGTRWLVGCRKATDGAMEIAAAFPFLPQIAMPKESGYNPIRDQKASLDEQISNARKK